MNSVTTKIKPQLSDIQIPGQRDAIVNNIDTVEDIQKVRQEHNIELSIRKREIITKVQQLEKKLTKHEMKEAMVDRIIGMTYTELDNLKENEFTKRGQKQSILIKQLEALGILQDTLIKFEDLIVDDMEVLEVG